MTIQDILKTLKIAKRPTPSPIAASSIPLSSSFNDIAKETLFSNLYKTPIFLSSLSSHKFHSFLTDPNIRTSECFLAFDFLLRYQSELSFKPDLHAHFTLVCRLIKSKKFSEAEVLLKNVAFHPNYGYPFSDFVSWVENYCNESRIITKLLNMLLKMYSDYKLFDTALAVFEYMVDEGFVRNEKTCSIHLLNLNQCEKIDLALDFFCRMVHSGMEVSSYSLTIVVSGLCNAGELNMSRELVDKMVGKGIKPNILMFNMLVDACTRRWDLLELDLVLHLMKRERLQFNDTTFKLLIEGYSGLNKIEQAEKLLFQMHDRGFEVESYLYCTVISGYCRLGNISNGLLLFTKMKEREVSPSVDTLWHLINGLCSVGEMAPVNDLVQEMQNKGCVLDNVILNVLLSAYNKAGMEDEAAHILRIIEHKSSSMIASSGDALDSEFDI